MTTIQTLEQFADCISDFFSETEVENGMTYQLQNQKNISEEQHIKTRLIAAKNYLEQQLELEGQKKTILFEKHNGLLFFYDQQRRLVATLQRGIFQVFFKDNSKTKSHMPQSAVSLETIQSKRALYCKRCKKWLEFHEGLTRCRCGKYLKTRKRFYIHKSQIEDSDVLAEIQFAIQDIKDAKRIESKKRRREIISTGMNSSIAGRYAKECDEPRQSIYLAEKATLKIHGHMVSDEYKIQAMMELCGIFSCIPTTDSQT